MAANRGMCAQWRAEEGFRSALAVCVAQSNVRSPNSKSDGLSFRIGRQRIPNQTLTDSVLNDIIPLLRFARPIAHLFIGEPDFWVEENGFQVWRAPFAARSAISSTIA